MQALTRVARAISYSCAHAHRHGACLARASDKTHWQERANLLTPVAKAFSTDIGVEVASLGIQVHGGMGFIEETGAAALYRDARIAPIYEGTNGIQAIDLVTRKLPQSGGEHVHGYIAELAETRRGAPHSNLDGFGRSAAAPRTGDRRPVGRHPRSSGDVVGRRDGQGAGRRHALSAAVRARCRRRLSGARRTRRTASAARIALCRFFAENLAGETARCASRSSAAARACSRPAEPDYHLAAWTEEAGNDRHIVIERSGPVQVIRMNRPDKKNALTRAMYQRRCPQALAEGDADPEVRVHVFLGVPGAFSAGNDLADFMAVATGGEGGQEVWNFLLALAGVARSRSSPASTASRSASARRSTCIAT